MRKKFIPEDDQAEIERELQLGSPGEGAEDEDDLDHEKLQRISDAVVAGTDWTSETLLRQLERGNIVLDPLFQRRDAWKPPRKSKFIESLIIGLPIPQLVLAENAKRKGSYIIIDGKQRLLSLRQFAAPEPDTNEALTLEGLEVRKDLNGHTFEELKADAKFAEDITAFYNQTIRTVVIKNWQNEDILYLIFLRLNTESVRLSPQELRQALHPGDFVRYVNVRCSESNGLHRIFNTRNLDFRMRDAELLVRYFAFRNFLTTYRGNLKAFLDTTCKALNDEWTERQVQIENQADEFEAAIAATFDIFGGGSFRKWNGSAYEGQFNRAVFDIMVFYFVDEKMRARALREKKAVESDFRKLCASDREFARAIETSTKSLPATVKRLSSWGRILRRRFQLSPKIPELQDKHIAL